MIQTGEQMLQAQPCVANLGPSWWKLARSIATW